MFNRKMMAAAAALVAMVVSGAAFAEPDHGQAPQGEHRGGPPTGRTSVRPPEPHPGPSGYQRLAEPPGWNSRPSQIDRGDYQHNFQAARGYHIGPYHPPTGWAQRRWGYGQILPRGYWSARYILADYWLFGLEVPPVGFEWVRVGADAVMIDLNTGEILQVEYGVFY